MAGAPGAAEAGPVAKLLAFGEPRGWGPIHTWRALGQFQAQAAIVPLPWLFTDVCDNGRIIEELPDVSALLGLGAFPELLEYLRE